MKRILESHLLHSANRLFPAGGWWFEWDNDPKHTSKRVTDWLFSKGVQVIDFPPYSPDLNPIENLWNNLKRRVERRNAQDVEQLKSIVREEWVSTDPNFLISLSASMPKRCKAVIKNRGHKTTY